MTHARKSKALESGVEQYRRKRGDGRAHYELFEEKQKNNTHLKMINPAGEKVHDKRRFAVTRRHACKMNETRGVARLSCSSRIFGLRFDLVEARARLSKRRHDTVRVG